MPTIVIEDGSSLPNANSYASVSDLRAFAADRGESVPVLDDDCAVLLLKAMDYIEPQAWLGFRFRAPSLQALEWPRYDVIVEGWPIKQNEIPRQLIYLQCAVAVEGQTVELCPTFLPNQHGSVMASEVSGAVREVYANNGRVLKVPAIERATRFLKVLTRKQGLFAIRS